MASEFTIRDEKSSSDPAGVGDVTTTINTGPNVTASETNQDAESYEARRHSPINAWLVVLSCFLLNFNLLGINYAYALTLTIGIPVGRSVEIFGFRKVALCGSILFSGALVAAGFCRTIPTLILTQGILNGIGAGILFIPATTAPAQQLPKRRSLSMGLSSAGAGVGGIFWSFFIRAIITRMGYQWALWLSGCVSAGINAFALCILKTRPMAPNSRQASIWSGLVMFKDARFVTLYCASCLSVFGYQVPFFYVPTYAQTQLHSSTLVGSILAAIMDLGMVVGRITLGLAADSKLGTMNSIISGMALAGLCPLVFWLPSSNSLPLLYVFCFSYGFLGGGYIGLLPAVLAHIFDPDKLPTITGLFLTSELPGQMAGGPIAGVILSSGNGQWTPVILFAGITIFCGSLFAVATRFQVQRIITEPGVTIEPVFGSDRYTPHAEDLRLLE
ncbi:major facilitator superfamily domain-containing protein [Gautieria morchelliformis]|nr:major facilitator superfamily domain-containing protein [Gautieria morchelliformis]